VGNTLPGGVQNRLIWMMIAMTVIEFIPLIKFIHGIKEAIIIIIIIHSIKVLDNS
jgi:hypothetical protein